MSTNLTYAILHRRDNARTEPIRSIDTVIIGWELDVNIAGLYIFQKQCSTVVNMYGCGGPDTSLCIPACGCSSGKQNYDKEKPKKKTNFFKKETIARHYEHHKNGVYKLKKFGSPVVKNGYYLSWNHLHGEVEIFDKRGRHVGALDPKTLNVHKAP